MSNDEIDTQRFKFLSLLIEKGPTSIGEDMYEMGRKLGFDEQLVKDIVNHYHGQDIIQFPILGPYIKLVYDWFKVLDHGDRTRLREGFLLTLKEMQTRSKGSMMTAKEVFEDMGFGAYSDTLIPAIVEALVLDGYIRKMDGFVRLLNRGEEECSRIEERKRMEYQETLHRLGIQ